MCSPREKEGGARHKEVEPRYPKVEFEYLVGWLDDLGWCETNGMGVQGVSWNSLFSWNSLTGADLDPWEAETLHQASLSYAIMWNEAKDPACPSPWSETRTDPKVLQDQIKNMFRSMIATQSKTKKDRKR